MCYDFFAQNAYEMHVVRPKGQNLGRSSIVHISLYFPRP